MTNFAEKISEIVKRSELILTTVGLHLDLEKSVETFDILPHLDAVGQPLYLSSNVQDIWKPIKFDRPFIPVFLSSADGNYGGLNLVLKEKASILGVRQFVVDRQNQRKLTRSLITSTRFPLNTNIDYDLDNSMFLPAGTYVFGTYMYAQAYKEWELLYLEKR